MEDPFYSYGCNFCGKFCGYDFLVSGGFCCLGCQIKFYDDDPRPDEETRRKNYKESYEAEHERFIKRFIEKRKTKQ
jgi:hypothetical protein